MSRVPAQVHDNDRHLIAALVMVNRLDEKDDPALHKVMIVVDNTKHLAVADNRKHGFEVIQAGVFLDRLFDTAPARTCLVIAKSLNDLIEPHCTLAELVTNGDLGATKSSSAALCVSRPGEFQCSTPQTLIFKLSADSSEACCTLQYFYSQNVVGIKA